MMREREQHIAHSCNNIRSKGIICDSLVRGLITMASFGTLTALFTNTPRASNWWCVVTASVKYDSTGTITWEILFKWRTVSNREVGIFMTTGKQRYL